MSATIPPILEQRVFGMPVAQQRPKTRLFRNSHSPIGVTASHYDPANCKDWKRTVLAQCIDARPPAPVEGPLLMALEFYLPRPLSLPKKELHHVKRPDLDNLAKAIKDALRGTIYRDDSQITDLIVSKRYSPGTGVLIRIERVVAPPKPVPQQFDLTTAPA